MAQNLRILISLQCIDTLGNIKLIPSNKIKFNYRSTKLDENLIFLSATFKGSILEKNKIRELMEEMSKKKIIHNHRKLKLEVVLSKIQSIKLLKKHGNLLKHQCQRI